MGRSKQPSSVFASKFFCSVRECGETFTKLSNLRRHTKNMHETEKTVELKYRCDVGGCDKVFRKRKQLYDHKFIVHDKERAQKYSCSQCPAKFAIPSKLTAHLKRHDGYQCPDCDFRAEIWSALRRHKAGVHPMVHKCEKCDMTFSRPYDVKKHQRVHEKAIKCPNADCKVEVLPWRMAKHVRVSQIWFIT